MLTFEAFLKNSDIKNYLKPYVNNTIEYNSKYKLNLSLLKVFLEMMDRQPCSSFSI